MRTFKNNDLILKLQPIYLLIIGLTWICQTTSSQVQVTNLPTIYLSTENNQPITSKEVYLPGTIQVVSSDITENLLMPMKIRGRGNSTWNLAKKPYRVKLAGKINFLNLPSVEDDWVFLANHADKTLIRNAVAFEISRILGFEFSPSAKFVDVYLNNSFLGNYMVSDQMERGNKRVVIEKQDTLDTTLPLISGGYLIEIDGFADREPVWFTTNKSLKVTIKYPDDKDINQQQFDYIKNFTNSFENALFSDNFKDPVTGYRNFVDTTSLINWYIASELTGNPDCFWSTYLYKRRDIDKFYFGPLWDYDIAFNNDYRLGNAQYSLMREKAFNPRTWIQRMWEDEWFRHAVNRRWKELVSERIENKILNYIDATVNQIDASQIKNYQRWPVLNTRVYNEQFLFPTYMQGIDFLKTYIINRISFLTTSFENSKPEEPSQPFIAEEFYYTIQNKGSNNYIDVLNNSTELNEKLVMWAPNQGDQSQEWEIKDLGGGKFHIINRNSKLAMTGNGRGVNLIQSTPDAQNSAQQWKITPVFTGNLYGLENVKTGYSVNNSGGNTMNGTAVIEYDNNIFNQSKINQHWYLQKTEIITSTHPLRFDKSEINFRIYPNPASEFITVKFSEPIDVPVSIYHIDGRAIYSENSNNKMSLRINLDNSGIQNGVFFIRIGNSIEKFIVQK
ncbi:MAG: T9SS type A sorting domain-containing protein [Porphyromonadaceae bacterium]|nr:T9SS type A sorting domain-containing protein [Porphyromonadaceae bacterium]